jgi:hypothetical protein
MLFSRACRYSLPLLLCVSEVLLLSQSLPGQTDTVDQQSQDSKPIYVPPVALNIACYENFLDWVGKENDHPQPGVPKIDYASAIGISKGREQAMLAILLNAYHKRTNNRRQAESAEHKLAEEEGAAEYFAHPPHLYGDMIAANRIILNDTYLKLKKVLGKDDFKKLDRYVSREFARDYPASLKLPAPAGQLKPTPFPVAVRYEFFIRHVGNEDRRVQQALQAGELNPLREDYSRAAHFPENEEQPMLTIVLEANEQLEENDREHRAAVIKFHEQYGMVPVRKFPHPELRTLAHKRRDIIMQTRERLKQELGDEYFNDLDAWIAHRWAGGFVYRPPQVNRPTGAQKIGSQ